MTAPPYHLSAANTYHRYDYNQSSTSISFETISLAYALANSFLSRLIFGDLKASKKAFVIFDLSHTIDKEDRILSHYSNVTTDH